MESKVINIQKYKEKLQKKSGITGYEIKVTIRDSKPPTWRRLEIPLGVTFNELAAIIETAFEWCGYHLYEFEVGSTIREQGLFISVPSEDEMDWFDSNRKTLDSGIERIDDYFNKYKRLKFIYDFGDYWVHDIVVEKTLEETLNDPICIKGKMEPYPEDCGGVWGFEEYCNPEERNPLDIESINQDLTQYKEFAEQLYDRYVFE